MQLLRLINGLLEKHPESRSRKLAAHAPIIVPVYSQVTPAALLLGQQTLCIKCLVIDFQWLAAQQLRLCGGKQFPIRAY